jgi:hypothetical protein
MNAILMYLFSKTRIGKLVDGKKTVIGAVLVIVVAALHALEQLAPMFPNAPWIGELSRGILEALRNIEPLLETLGLSFLTVGVLHKGAKAKS